MHPLAVGEHVVHARRRGVVVAGGVVLAGGDLEGLADAVLVQRREAFAPVGAELRGRGEGVKVVVVVVVAVVAAVVVVAVGLVGLVVMGELGVVLLLSLFVVVESGGGNGEWWW